MDARISDALREEVHRVREWGRKEARPAGLEADRNAAPLPVGHPFWTMPNVLVSPHYSGETVNTSRLPAQRFVRNLHGVPRLRSLLQHIRRETREPGLVDRIRSAPRIENKIRGHHRQARTIVVIHGQPI